MPYGPHPYVYDGKAVVPTTIYLNSMDDVTGIAQYIRSGGNDPPVYLLYVNAWGNDNNPMEMADALYTQLSSDADIAIVKPSVLFSVVCAPR